MIQLGNFVRKKAIISFAVWHVAHLRSLFERTYHQDLYAPIWAIEIYYHFAIAFASDNNQIVFVIERELINLYDFSF